MGNSKAKNEKTIEQISCTYCEMRSRTAKRFDDLEKEMDGFLAQFSAGSCGHSGRSRKVVTVQ